MNWWHNLHLCCGLFPISIHAAFWPRVIRIRFSVFRPIPTTLQRLLKKHYFLTVSADSADRVSVLFLLHTWLVWLRLPLGISMLNILEYFLFTFCSGISLVRSPALRQKTKKKREENKERTADSPDNLILLPARAIEFLVVHSNTIIPLIKLPINTIN